MKIYDVELSFHVAVAATSESDAEHIAIGMVKCPNGFEWDFAHALRIERPQDLHSDLENVTPINVENKTCKEILKGAQ